MDCKLDVTVGYRLGKSYMKDVFVSPPFRVVPVGQIKFDDAEYLMIVSVSPGILNGDHYDINVHVEEDARLQLQSQSYQRLFNMDGGATQEFQIQLDKNASLSYVPHPVVPHENSTFKSFTKVEMMDESELIMGEIVTCGRKYHGEVFRFKHFQNRIEVRHHDKLIFKDNVLLQPDLMPLGDIGLLEGFTHQGMLIYLNLRNQSVDELIERFFAELSLEEDMEFGISRLQANGLVIRCLAYGGDQIYHCFQRIQAHIWDQAYVQQI